MNTGSLETAEDDAMPMSPGEVSALMRRGHRNFAKIVSATDGRQVLFYVEPRDGEYIFHQVANHEDFQADLAIGFTSDDPDRNERAAFSVLEAADQGMADKAIDAVRQMMDSA